METEPQLLHAKTWIPPETPVKYKAEDAHVHLHSCHVERLVRAFGVEVLQIKTSLEEPLQSSGKQWLDSVRRLHYRPAAWTETAATSRVPKEDKDADIAFLPKPGKDTGDAKLLENRCVAQPHWQGSGKSISSSILCQQLQRLQAHANLARSLEGAREIQ